MNTWNTTSVPGDPDSIFVFGSNTEGRHGKGAAMTARQWFGAVYGQAEGLQGRSFAIITKDLRLGNRSIPLGQISQSVAKFYAFAATRPDLAFYVTKIGCGLAGWTEKKIGDLFRSHAEKCPDNVYLPEAFV